MIESVRRRKHTTHRKSDVTLEKKKKRQLERREHDAETGDGDCILKCGVFP